MFFLAIQPKNIIYTNQTGHIPVASSQGSQYIVIAYNVDSNAILLRPIKNRSTAKLTKSLTSIHQTLTDGGCKPKYHRMDNEYPKELKHFLRNKHIDVQLTPPHDHRANTAECSICTTKNHILAGWASMHNDFPMHLWDRTILQAE